MKRCNMFRSPRMKKWEVMLICYGGDPHVEDIETACRKYPKFQSWMRLYGEKHADDVIPEAEMVVCGDIKVQMCGYSDCDYPAEFLCDWPVGKGKTCDLPVCRNHAVQQRHEVHFCPVHQAVFVGDGRVSDGYQLELMREKDWR